MNFINIEMKARCFHPQKVEAFLFAQGAEFIGTDYQKDTYFHVPEGRLKLRQGNIENNLIFYRRENVAGVKQSDFMLTPVADGAAMERLLQQSLGIKVIVEKQRKIFYIDNIKFHIDVVKGLGSFVEIEAGNKTDLSKTKEMLQEQCDEYVRLLEIQQEDFLAESYSDMLLAKDHSA